MIAELGLLALICALCVAVVQSIWPLLAAWRGEPLQMASARALALLQLLFCLFSFMTLVHAFIVNDFSLAYVAHNSNSLLPVQYRISAVWGAHEGSLLLWVLILAGWGAAVALLSRSLPDSARARVLAVLGMLSVGFYLFILLTSNPFDRLLPLYPVDGRDLNPLLQDFGLIVHPPMLYMGYVGFAVAFAFAIAALLEGQLNATWARWARPWTLAAWIFLTLGIALGSWWAYYELGWGGWWFWDPVENASLMPWLVGTALLHSLSVSDKRNSLHIWTTLLAIFSFSLSLLGTFLVRSGVLVSVHAFASDPERGLFILGFLVAVIGGSLLLFALRAANVKTEARFELLSRESALVFNNIMLTAAMLVVLLGTLLPLIYKQIGLGSVSVGPPFFNQVFFVLVLCFVPIMGVGPLLRWRRHQGTITPVLGGSLLLSVMLLAAGFLCYADQFHGQAAIGAFLGCWLLVLLAWLLVAQWRQSQPVAGGRGRGFWGMTLAHLGFAITLIGISVTSYYSIEKDVRMAPGDSIELAEYQFLFKGTEHFEGPNFISDRGTVEIRYQGRLLSTLHPEKRFYHAQRSMMTEAAIDAGILRDLYVALGENLGDGAWAVRVYYKPLVRWLWLGAIIMAIGGGLSMADKRYRRKNSAPVTEEVAV